jgi:hypothetical protein
MVAGGLILHPKYSYSVTIKADGIRKLLVFHSSGIWLVMAKDEADLVIRFDQDLSRKLSGFYGYILEGELIPQNIDGSRQLRRPGAPDQKYWYLVYDCLAIPDEEISKYSYKPGSITVQKQPHTIRMKYAQRFANLFVDNQLITIETKKFYGFGTAEMMFGIIRQLDLLGATNYYEDDGYVFTAEEMPYDMSIGIDEKGHQIRIWNLPLKDRVLTKYPDICKWKPPRKLTIDFSIEWYIISGGQRSIRLLVGKSSRMSKGKLEKELVLFTGTRNFPFSVTEGRYPVDDLNPITANLPTGTVVEYKWDYDKNIMVPTRVRGDKNDPNLEKFAIDTWLLIKNSIQLSTIKGEDFKLMRRYHNRIKDKLFRSALDNLKKKRVKLTALDIGSGVGGDTFKLRGFDRILFVEPNQDYIPELSSRIRDVYGQKEVEIITLGDNIPDKIQLALSRQDKSLILNTGGENSALIREVVQVWLEGPASLLSLMLSMSFFWSSSQMTKALETTILENLSPTGEGIFFTINGELVKHSFNPQMLSNGERIGGQEKEYDSITMGAATLKYFFNESKLIINIPDTIVVDQTEYPPYLSDLTPGLSSRGWVIDDLEIADQELFLNLGESTLTKLYTAGKIKSKGGLISSRLPAKPSSLLTTSSISSIKPIIPLETKPGPTIKPPTTNLILRPQSEPQLPMLPIWYDGSRDIGVGDDAVEKINVTWYKDHPVVRIATLGNGSCFFNAILKAFYAPYANTSKYSDRTEMVRKLRRDLAAILTHKDPSSAEGKTYYQTAAKGAWVEFSQQQLSGVNLGFDPSLSAMQSLFNSTGDVGNEVYQFVGDLLGIDIYVMMATKVDLHPTLNTSLKGRHQPSVIIAGNGYHYETIGIDTGPKAGIQTVFYQNDPFLMALRGRITDEEGI